MDCCFKATLRRLVTLVVERLRQRVLARSKRL